VPFALHLPSHFIFFPLSPFVFVGVVTLIICVIVQKTVGFRLDEESERMGLDQSLHGEHGYGHSNTMGF